MASRVYNGWVYEQDATGGWVRSRPASSPAPKPTYELEAPKMQADINSTNTGIRRTQVQTQGDLLDNEGKARTIRQNPLSATDQAFINEMRKKSGDLPGVYKDITAAQRAVDDFKPFPGKGILYGMGTPTDEDGPITGPLKAGIGNLLPDETQEDYQTLLGLQNANVLAKQIEQSGPQTESDAIRMKLTGVSPNKSVMPNARLLAEQQYDVMMKMERPSFYTYWANKLGSTQALNSRGQSADQVWNQQYQRGLEQMRRDPRYKTGRVPTTSTAPRKPSGGLSDDLKRKYGL